MRLLDLFSGLFIEKAFAAQVKIWHEYCSAFGSSCGDGSSLLRDLAANASGFFFALIGGGAVVSVIVAGLKIVFSAGNDGKIEEGKKIITYAAIGIALATAVGAIIAMVQTMVE